MIHDVILTPLKQIRGDKGMVMHMLRSTDPVFTEFGEIYFSTVPPGAVKAWKRHVRMTLNIACIHGEARFVIYDDRPGSPSHGTVQEIVLGPESQYLLVTVPPGLWTGFTTTGDALSIVANCASLPHDPAETERRDATDPAIPYTWS